MNASECRAAIGLLMKLQQTGLDLMAGEETSEAPSEASSGP